MSSSSTLLCVKDLRKWYPIRRGVLARTHGYVRAVDNVSLTIQQGETVGLVGESGCGKTTLARILAGLDTPTKGSIEFQGLDLHSASRSQLADVRQRLQIIFQDPFSSLNPRMTAGDIVSEGLVEHGRVRRRGRRDAAAELLSDVGLGTDTMDRFPHEFSGGQRQRISIARAISLRPALVICDEAVSALDVSVQAQVINLLMDLRDKYGLSYLFISHDISVVRHVADRIAVMYLGRIVEKGITETVLDDALHPYTKALVSAVPRVGAPAKERIILKGDVPSPSQPPSGCHFHPRCPLAVASCQTITPTLMNCGHVETSPRLVSCNVVNQTANLESEAGTELGTPANTQVEME